MARWIADRLLYAGLLGEIVVGIIFGKPLGAILHDSWEQTFLALGYIGLLLIVFEGNSFCVAAWFTEGIWLMLRLMFARCQLLVLRRWLDYPPSKACQGSPSRFYRSTHRNWSTHSTFVRSLTAWTVRHARSLCRWRGPFFD